MKSAVTLCQVELSRPSMDWMGDHILFTDRGTAKK